MDVHRGWYIVSSVTPVSIGVRNSLCSTDVLQNRTAIIIRRRRSRIFSNDRNPAVSATGQDGVDDPLNPMGVVRSEVLRNPFATDGHSDLPPRADHRIVFAVDVLQRINLILMQRVEE